MQAVGAEQKYQLPWWQRLWLIVRWNFFWPRYVYNIKGSTCEIDGKESTFDEETLDVGNYDGPVDDTDGLRWDQSDNRTASASGNSGYSNPHSHRRSHSYSQTYAKGGGRSRPSK